MTQSKHTPGPWRAEVDHEGMWQIWAKAGNWLASLLGSKQEANARLIAAAPELLRALELVAEAHNDELQHQGKVYTDGNMIRDVIAKAKGA